MTKQRPGRPKLDEDRILTNRSKELLHHLDERTQHIALSIDYVLDRYLEHRNRLAQELHSNLKEAYWHSGMYFRIERRKVAGRDYFTYDLLWAQGKVVKNDPTYRPNTDIKIKFTNKVHRCDRGGKGNYTLDDLKTGCRGKAYFEPRLALEYEKVIRPLREDLRNITKLIKMIMNLGYIPEVDSLLESIPAFDIKESLAKILGETS